MDISNYKAPKIIALEIDEFDEESGVDAIALVEQPAIELDWIYFSKNNKNIFQSYNDYPKAASENACKVLRWIDEYGRDEVAGMTQVGLARANQLCNRENISEETIARMAAFARHKKNAEINPEYKGTPWKDKGYVAWLGWGGDEGIAWAARKLKQIREELDIDVSEIGDYIPTGSDIIPKDVFVENAGGFSVGDYVSWTYAGRGEGDDRGRGQIKELRVSGTLKVPGTDFELKPTEDRPAALIETRDGSVVGQYTDNLRKIQKPEDFNIEKYLDFYFDLVDYIDGLPLFTTKEEAQQVADMIGCDGTHEHEIEGFVFYMPCTDHDEATEAFLKEVEELLKKRKKKYTGENEDRLKADSWVLMDDEQKFVISSKPNEPSHKNIEQSNFSEIQKEKKLIAGPLMIPRKLIYRWDELNGDYYVYFSEETIAKIAYKYMVQKNQDRTNLEHAEGMTLEDVVLVESWLVEEPEKDKSFALTGKKYEKGTWFGIMKVKNESVWQDWVKTGKVAGFSVEGFFSDRLINASKHRFYYRTTDGGTEIVIDHETYVVFILKDGERSAILPDGTYELTNGKKLVVKDSKAIEGSF